MQNTEARRAELLQLFFTEAEITVLLAEPQPDNYQAFAEYSRLKSEERIRKSIFDAAANGHAPSQSRAIRLIEKFRKFGR